MMTEYQKISDLVEENHSYAYVLNCFGIEFYKWQDQTLAEACHCNQISVDRVSETIESLSNYSRIDTNLLEQSSIGLVVEYLKHAHQVFIKKSLPFMLKLVNELRKDDYLIEQVIEDIKVVFPLFAEDFIHHIYEEEDHLFSYIDVLTRIDRGELAYSKAYYEVESMDLKAEALEHEHADDEMSGIRKLTGNYKTGVESDLILSVLYKELNQFENELVFHAKVENEIFFPKAFDLEDRVRSKIKRLVLQN